MPVSLRALTENDRDIAAQLYWEAFQTKLGRVLGPTPKALVFLRDAIQPAYGLAAVDAHGTVLGVAGFKTEDGGFIAAGFRDLVTCYGLLSALWRAPLLDMFERAADAHVLQMDGICVTAAARGQGIGSLLLDGILAQARHRGFAQVQLDVIGTNPRARALYERHGFVEVATRSTGIASLIVGFGAYSTMVCDL